MSTRSYICKENEDGTITGSYCHCDGYLTYNGAMLIDHYNTKERVDKLLSLGNMLKNWPKPIDPIRADKTLVKRFGRKASIINDK